MPQGPMHPYLVPNPTSGTETDIPVQSHTCGSNSDIKSVALNRYIPEYGCIGPLGILRNTQIVTANLLLFSHRKLPVKLKIFSITLSPVYSQYSNSDSYQICG